MIRWSLRRKVIFRLEIVLLKFGKLWSAIIPKVVILGERAKDRSKRRIFLFRTHFCLSRYNFRFPRYRRVKRKLIFNRFQIPAKYYKFLEKRTFRKKYSQVRSRHALCLKRYESLYLDNRLRYRNESKRSFGVTILSVSRVDFDGKIFIDRFKRVSITYKNPSYLNNFVRIQTI